MIDAAVSRFLFCLALPCPETNMWEGDISAGRPSLSFPPANEMIHWLPLRTLKQYGALKEEGVLRWIHSPWKMKMVLVWATEGGHLWPGVAWMPQLRRGGSLWLEAGKGGGPTSQNLRIPNPDLRKWSEVKVTLSCPTLCDPVYYTVHGIVQARILEWVAFPFSRGSSQPRDWTQVFSIAGRFFTSWATREAQEYWSW